MSTTSTADRTADARKPNEAHKHPAAVLAEEQEESIAAISRAVAHAQEINAIDRSERNQIAQIIAPAYRRVR